MSCKIIHQKSRVDGFSVIIPTMFKRKNVLNLLLEILEKESLVNEVILINNTTERYFPNSKKLKVFNMGKNIFVNPAWNLGINNSSSKYFCLLNDDILLPENLFQQIYEFLSNNPNAGIIGVGDSSFVNVDVSADFELLNYSLL